MTRIAELIARIEGYGVPGAIPTVRNNPGDLRHSPHSQHPGGPAHANDVGTIDTAAHGWADLERQLSIFANMGLTLRQAIYVYLGVPKNATAEQVAAAPDGNNVHAYLNFVASGLGVSPETPLSEVLKIQGTGTMGHSDAKTD